MSFKCPLSNAVYKAINASIDPSLPVKQVNALRELQQLSRAMTQQAIDCVRAEFVAEGLLAS